MSRLIINAIAFQVGWIACVLGAAYGLPWTGVLVALTIVAWHLSRAVRPERELLLMATVGALGAMWDSVLVAAGWLVYPSGVLLNNTAPYWIVALWVLFASTLNVSLRWLRGRWLLAAVLGALAGPLAYAAGAGLGAVTLAHPFAGFTALALGWALLLPLLIRLAARYDGMGSAYTTAEA